MHLNGDEAMCFGAAFVAANSSASFKVRKVYLTQHPTQSISIKISPVNETKISAISEEQETVQQVVSDESNESTEAQTQSTNGITY